MSLDGIDTLDVADDRRYLRADCGQCAGLCCVAPAFAASADFAVDKPAGEPCSNLLADFRCGIHDRLRERGFPGCAVFDCFGAGQQVTRRTFGGRTWKAEPEWAESMFTVFGVMRQLHEMLWYLVEARERAGDGELRDELDRRRERIQRLTESESEQLAAVEPSAYRRDVGPLLERVSDRVRSGVREHPADRRGADLIGAQLRGADLRATTLRGAYLLGADLRDADLRWADLLGADLRGANLCGADLGDSLFVTQPTLEAARGDSATRIPDTLARPEHWATSSEDS